MSVVYLARDQEAAGTRVVIKVLLDRTGPEPSVIEKLKQMSALARLEQPSVTGAIDTGYTADGNLFLVTQYAEGVTLRGTVVPGGIDFARTTNIIRRIGEALSVVHENGITHLDLKPENVLLVRDGPDEGVRLLDFGMAGIRDARYGSDSASGRPGMSYLAPEQLTGKACVASDTYTLGLIACELLTGESPDSLRNLVAENAGGRTVLGQLRPDLPAEAEWALMKATSFRPEDRQISAREFSEELHRALTGDKSSGRATPPGAVQVAHVLFTDLVSYSMLSMDQQKEYLGEFQRIVRGSAAVRTADAAGELISLPRGDGVALVFFGDPTAPVRCAVEVARELKKRPHLRLRMGIHTGPVYRVADINANADVAGGAINMAQRVMDCGDAGHILLSKTLADMLLQLNQWSPYLTDFGECTVKHDVKVHLYSLATEEVGNREPPAKLALPSVSKSRPKALVAASLFLAAVGAAVAGWLAHSGRSPGSVQEASIAVLPFTDMTPENNQAYLSEGLAEELLNGLASAQGLRVAGRTSAFRFKGNTDGTQVIGQKLNVATVLEGSVREQGNRARVAVELVRAKDGFILWSATFDRDMNDMLTVEREIANAVMVELEPKLLGRNVTASSPGSTNAEAYNAYLQGKYFKVRSNRESLGKSVGYFQQAIKLDPAYARAWVELAKSFYAEADAGYIPSEQGYQKARAAAERALRLDPKMGDAHAAQGWIQLHYDWNWPGADASFQRALALEPGNVTVISSAAGSAAVMGRLDEAISREQRVVEIDPLNSMAYRNMAIYLNFSGEQPKAAAALGRALELAPESAITHGMLGRVYLAEGRPEEALSEANKEKDLELRLQVLALAFHALGRKKESDANLAELMTKFPADDPFYIAEVFAFRRETDKAFEWLERAYTARDAGLTEIKNDPLLKSLEPDPRYALLLNKMRLPL